MNELLENMQMLRDNFQVCRDPAAKLVHWANEELGEMDKKAQKH